MGRPHLENRRRQSHLDQGRYHVEGITKIDVKDRENGLKGRLSIQTNPASYRTWKR
jgi:hypothetical protein